MITNIMYVMYIIQYNLFLLFYNYIDNAVNCGMKAIATVKIIMTTIATRVLFGKKKISWHFELFS